MTVVSVRKDAEALTVTIVARFDAAIGRVWQLWSDPRLLERWWGPPDHPATVLEHDLEPGGRVTYRTTGSDGDAHGGWWRVLTVDPPRHLEFEDGFADEPYAGLPPTVVRVTLAERDGGGTDMHIVFAFPTLEAMEQIIAMGFEEGLTGAVGQIDELLAVN